MRGRAAFCKPSSTKALAQKYLLTNWPAIERMAREALATGILEDGQVKLVA